MVLNVALVVAVIVAPIVVAVVVVVLVTVAVFLERLAGLLAIAVRAIKPIAEWCCSCPAELLSFEVVKYVGLPSVSTLNYDHMV